VFESNIDRNVRKFVVAHFIDPLDIRWTQLHAKQSQFHDNLIDEYFVV